MILNLVIVAHPDDESIWASDILDETTFVLVINGKNRYDEKITINRRNEMNNAMKMIKCEYKICNFPDKQYRWSTDLINNINSEILDTIKKFKFLKNIYTHNEYGEYGHIDHIKLHYLVKEIYVKNINKSINLFVFDPELGYDKNNVINSIEESFKCSQKILDRITNKNIKYTIDTLKRKNLLDNYKHGNIDIFRNIILSYKLLKFD